MFCGKCGGKNPDDAQVCQSCGASLAPEAPAGEKQQQQPKNLAMVIGGAVVALLALFFLFNLFFGGSAKNGAVKYLKAMNSKNGGNTLLNLTMPSKVMKETLNESELYNNKSEWVKDLNDLLENNWENRKEEKTKYSYKVVDVINAKSNRDSGFDEDTLDQLKEAYKDEYNLRVKDGKRVYVYMKTVNSDGKGGRLIAVDMIKIGFKWYVYSCGYDPAGVGGGIRGF